MTTDETSPETGPRTTSTRSTVTLSLPGVGAVPVTVDDQDGTRPHLLLHGGAGPASVAAFGDLLAARGSARVVSPTHPGFAGTPRPDGLGTVRDLARLYVELLEVLDLHDVTVIGNSLGGWLAAEIGLRGSPRVSALVILDAVGAHVADEPVVDVRTLTPSELLARSFVDPSRAAAASGGRVPDPALVQANLAALYTYGGDSMSDPTLLSRLQHLDLPTHVIWGAADRVVGPAHARAYADAIAGSRLDVLAGAGHLPQLETPDAVLELVNGR